MNPDGLIKLKLDNAKLVAQGNYSGLLCPKCNRRSVEAYFSEQNLKKGYGIWFECKVCGHVEHISCKSEPEGFTPLRIAERFQKLDDRSWDAEEKGL